MNRAVVRLVAGALAVSALAGCSCSTEGEAAAPPPVTAEIRSGWSHLGDNPEAIAAGSATARGKGNPAVADALTFYSDAARTTGDVLSVVTTADGRAALAIRRHVVDGPLSRAVARVVADAKRQGGTISATSVTFHGVPAWELVHKGAPAGLRDVTYWFDRSNDRYTVEISGATDDVVALADAVRIT